MKTNKEVSKNDWVHVLSELEQQFTRSNDFEKLRFLEILSETFFQIHYKVLCRYHCRERSYQTKSLRESIFIKKALSELLSSTSINPEFWKITALSNCVWIVLIYQSNEEI